MIWAAADEEPRGKLTEAQFMKAIKLCAIRQAGGAIIDTPEALRAPAPLPQLGRADADAASPPPPAGGASSSSSSADEAVPGYMEVTAAMADSGNPGYMEVGAAAPGYMEVAANGDTGDYALISPGGTLSDADAELPPSFFGQRGAAGASRPAAAADATPDLEGDYAFVEAADVSAWVAGSPNSSSAAPPSQQQQLQQQPATSGWSCTRCSFANEALALVCAVCQSLPESEAAARRRRRRQQRRPVAPFNCSSSPADPQHHPPLHKLFMPPPHPQHPRWPVRVQAGWAAVPAYRQVESGAVGGALLRTAPTM